jgi:hypothetical protein
VEAAVPQWERLLRCAVVDEEASALIDVGALLAGVSNAAAAERVVDYLTTTAGLMSPLRGVVYFDGGTWMVRGLEGRVQPLRSSPGARERRVRDLRREPLPRG